jgi:hypothetical protein
MAEAKRLSGDDWRLRLAETFRVNGIIGGHLISVYDDERIIEADLVKTYHGQDLLMCSFLSFFVETLQAANGLVNLSGWPKACPHYTVALVGFSNLFRRFRACELLYSKGYPLDGYAMMRDIKDRAFMMAAVAKNRITFAEVYGTKEGLARGDKEYGRKTMEIRKKASKRIFAEFMGDSSGLPQTVRDDLKMWEDLFHAEVHNGSLTLTHDLQALHGSNIAPRIGPTKIAEAYTIYINRTSEIGWMLVRLLPFLQPSKAAFGGEWVRKKEVLDDSFRYMLETLASLDKRLGSSFITMIDKKFRFKDPFHYFESTYKYP